MCPDPQLAAENTAPGIRFCGAGANAFSWLTACWWLRHLSVGISSGSDPRHLLWLCSSLLPWLKNPPFSLHSFFPFPNQCRLEHSALICSKCPTEPEDYTSEPDSVLCCCYCCYFLLMMFLQGMCWQQLQLPGITLMWQRDFQDWDSPQSLAFSHTQQELPHYNKNLPSILFRWTRVVCLSQTAQKDGVVAAHLFCCIQISPAIAAVLWPPLTFAISILNYNLSTVSPILVASIPWHSPFHYVIWLLVLRNE